MDKKPIDNDRGITDELIQDILNNVCLVNNIIEPEPLKENPSETDIEEYKKVKTEYDYKISLLSLYIRAICTNILIKTNRRMFIPDLKYVVIDLVNDKWASTDSVSGDTLNSIQSMSEAGRSVNFGASNVVANKLNLIAKKQLEENELLINKFKLLYRT